MLLMTDAKLSSPMRAPAAPCEVVKPGARTGVVELVESTPESPRVIESEDMFLIASIIRRTSEDQWWRR
jgi:hypothetical protein